MANTMQLIVDVFMDGSHVHTWHAGRIKDEIDWWDQYTVDQTKRTRYHNDSRFHVYLHANDDPTERLTLIFRYAA
jgi:hypothetical protein